jgi:general stress protein YciG
MSEKEMSVREAGRKGGQKTAERHGHDFYEKIGKKGGEARKQALGPTGYEALGRQGGQKVRELVRKGKLAEG